MLQLAERRKKRGRPTTTQISKRQAIEREIFRLGMGLLPGEEEPPPPPTNDQLLDSAQLHPEDHGASIEAADADSDDPDNDDIQDGDASGEGDEGPIVAEKISRPRQAPKLSKHQYDECVARVKEVKAGTADNFMFLSPEPTMKKRFSKPAHTLQSVIVWLPQYLWRRSNLGVPDQPPCPHHAHALAGVQAELRMQLKAQAQEAVHSSASRPSHASVLEPPNRTAAMLANRTQAPVLNVALRKRG